MDKRLPVHMHAKSCVIIYLQLEKAYLTDFEFPSLWNIP
jgi:hypothetical protein